MSSVAQTRSEAIALRAQVKMLALQIGLRAAARECGLKEDTVKKWAQRYDWRVSRMPAVSVAQPVATNGRQPPVVPTQSPDAALQSIMSSLATRTKVAMASSSNKVFEHLADADAAALARPATAIAASKWSGVAATAHGWSQGDATKVAVQINFQEENAKAQELWRALRAAEAQETPPPWEGV
jgi:hypothetical protein